MQFLISRRRAAAVFAAIVLAPTAFPQQSLAAKKQSAGGTEWVPERSIDGPVVIIVSLPEQSLKIYRNGIQIGRCPVSTGKKGHETPVGVFCILEKDEDHRSTLYKEGGGEQGASMPFMERLTWDGVSLHAGSLPGYPTSHGCVHIPLAFAKQLYTVTHIGTPVIVADDHSEPKDVVHSDFILSGSAEEEALAAVQKAGKRKLFYHHLTGDHKPTALVVSYEDKATYLFESGEVVLTEPLEGLKGRGPKADQVFVLHDVSGTERVEWFAVGYRQKTSGGKLPQAEPEVLQKIELTEASRRRVMAAMHPGFTVVVTRRSANQQTRTAKGFTIAKHG